MAFVLQIKPKARKNLDKLPEAYRPRIWQALREIEADSFFGKKLSGKRADQYSVRVWPYRIVYIIKKKELIVLVIDVGHRQGVY